jgi:hypothetical protein
MRRSSPWRGYRKPGELVISLCAADGDKETDTEACFIEALGYWENLFNDLELMAGKAKLPAKINHAPGSSIGIRLLMPLNSQSF